MGGGGGGGSGFGEGAGPKDDGAPPAVPAGALVPLPVGAFPRGGGFDAVWDGGEDFVLVAVVMLGGVGPAAPRWFKPGESQAAVAVTKEIRTKADRRSI